jgi:hypothetical protein
VSTRLHAGILGGPVVAAIMPTPSLFAVFLVVVLILGYVVIWAIWHFGFRNRDDEGRRIKK